MTDDTTLTFSSSSFGQPFHNARFVLVDSDRLSFLQISTLLFSFNYMKETLDLFRRSSLDHRDC